MMIFLKHRIKTLLLLLIVSCFGCLLSHAQTSSSASKPGLKKQVINFEDELVEGSTQKPELFYLLQKKNFNYKRLIKLRENFLPEMRRSSEDIKRLRGGN